MMLSPPSIKDSLPREPMKVGSPRGSNRFPRMAGIGAQGSLDARAAPPGHGPAAHAKNNARVAFTYLAAGNHSPSSGAGRAGQGKGGSERRAALFGCIGKVWLRDDTRSGGARHPRQREPAWPDVDRAYARQLCRPRCTACDRGGDPARPARPTRRPRRRFGSVLFLASGEPRWVTGRTVTVDGGYLAI